MRKIPVVISAVVLWTLALSAVGLGAGRVGVIDLALIIDESTAGRQANAVLNEFIAERQQTLASMETELEEMAEALDNDAESMFDEERTTLQAEFDALAEEYLTLVEQFELEIGAAVHDLRDHV